MSSFNKSFVLKDSREFEKLFREKYRILVYMAYKYVNDTATAEEIAQDVMVKLWEKRDELHVKGPIMAYLAISIRNTCFNFLKHKKIVHQHEKEEAQRYVSDPTIQASEMADMEIESALLNAMSELPPQRRKIFEMSRLDGLKYHEIATKLGLSIKTIETQMGLALKQLREKLKYHMGVLMW